MLSKVVGKCIINPVTFSTCRSEGDTYMIRQANIWVIKPLANQAEAWYSFHKQWEAAPV